MNTKKGWSKPKLIHLVPLETGELYEIVGAIRFAAAELRTGLKVKSAICEEIATTLEQFASKVAKTKGEIER